MLAGMIANRKWMIVAGAAVILALVLGVKIGRSIIPSGSDGARAAKPTQVRFSDRRNGLSLSYPSTWHRLSSRDPQVRLVAALSPATSLSLRVSKTELDDLTSQTVKLPVVRQFTDDLLAADPRPVQLLSDPESIELGGLVGYRYRYSYAGTGATRGAHVHYFLFKHRLLVQLVFQAQAAKTLAGVEPTFNAIARTFASTGR